MLSWGSTEEAELDEVRRLGAVGRGVVAAVSADDEILHDVAHGKQGRCSVTRGAASERARE